ncbi:MAG: S-layer homology domain-containing protein [Clostridia bacterium]|nr:S-layer homology domain-containing protein [Clostridia bacterium]
MKKSAFRIFALLLAAVIISAYAATAVFAESTWVRIGTFEDRDERGTIQIFLVRDGETDEVNFQGAWVPEGVQIIAKATPNKGYKFAQWLVTNNPTGDDYTVMSKDAEVTFETPEKETYLYARFDEDVAEPKVINKLEFDVEYPTAGRDIEEKVTATEGIKASVRWFKVNDIGNATELDKDNIAREGQRYKPWIFFETEYGYKLSEYVKTATVNGESTDIKQTSYYNYAIYGASPQKAKDASKVNSVSFENFTAPKNGAVYKPDVKLSDDTAGEIVSQKYIMYKKDLTGTVASVGDNIGLEIGVKLTSGTFDKNVKGYLGGEESYSAELLSDTQCVFGWSIKVEYPESIKIKSQSPETIEYTKGEDVKLFVNADGADEYQWCMYEEKHGGAKTFYAPNPVKGAQNAEYVIENADETYDGKEFRCTLKNDEGELYTERIKLKLTDGKKDGKKVEWLDASDWAEEELKKAQSMDLIPEIFSHKDLTRKITRLEFAHVAVKLYESVMGKTSAPAANPFTDTDDTEVLKAYNIGITLGTSDTTFSPDEYITREQMATMLCRALSETGMHISVNLDGVEKFSDDGIMHDWGREAIYFMSENGIILGMGDGTFGVLENATREQAILITVRIAEKL